MDWKSSLRNEFPFACSLFFVVVVVVAVAVFVDVVSFLVSCFVFFSCFLFCVSCCFLFFVVFSVGRHLMHQGAFNGYVSGALS